MNLYRVWQLGLQRAVDARITAAADADDVVRTAHERATWEGEAGDEHVYCVQLVSSGPMRRGEKVQVVRSTREVVPVFRTGAPLTRDELRARCSGCRRRFLDLDERPARGLCRRCAVREYMREGKVKVPA